MKKIIFMAALVSMLASCIDGFKGDNTADRERSKVSTSSTRLKVVST